MNDTESPEPRIVQLDDVYRPALIGHTVGPLGQTKYAYSLTRLARIEQTLASVSEEYARERVIALISEIHLEVGTDAPLFIDDSANVIRRIATKEKSRIIIPGGFGG